MKFPLPDLMFVDDAAVRKVLRDVVGAKEFDALEFSIRGKAAAVKVDEATPEQTLSDAMKGNQNARKGKNSGSNTTADSPKQERGKTYTRLARDRPDLREEARL